MATLMLHGWGLFAMLDHMMTQPLSPRHQANIVAKAERALAAIDALITRVIIHDDDFPEVTDLATGREFLHTELDTDQPEKSAGWWVAIGMMHDRLQGRDSYRAGELPTQFRSSRETVLDKLDAAIWADRQPAPTDPFEGLGEAF